MFPILFESKFFILYSYPLFMGLAWGFGYFFTKDLFEKNHIDQKGLISLFLGEFISAWIGAKIFFLWFSSGPKIYQYLYAHYFWLGGGFVFYGGLVFGLIFYFVWAIILKKFKSENSAYLLPGLIFGHSIGRVGCFFTGCCYGVLTNSFIGVNLYGEKRIPVQLFEAVILFLIGLVVLKMLKNKIRFVISFYLICYSSFRFLLEFMRGDEIRGFFIKGLSTSQIISILIVFSTLLLAKFNWKKE